MALTDHRINIGSAPNDGTGDDLRHAFAKVNDFFDDAQAMTEAAVSMVTDGTTSAAVSATAAAASAALAASSASTATASASTATASASTATTKAAEASSSATSAAAVLANLSAISGANDWGGIVSDYGSITAATVFSSDYGSIL